ncbi:MULTISPECIES: hypothetical protein [Vibrio]|uniref:hypothetical protein n=1 Tax=Vibrio TaxID=662 RepID=UPI000B5C6296|nr:MULTISPECIES: hypothetical protein [Vibrio]HBV76819.1 hypothetical protein [Vibrio sp.]
MRSKSEIPNRYRPDGYDYYPIDSQLSDENKLSLQLTSFKEQHSDLYNVVRFIHALITVLKHHPNGEVDLIMNPESSIAEMLTYKTQQWQALEEVLLGIRNNQIHAYVNVRVLSDYDKSGDFNVCVYSFELIAQNGQYILKQSEPVPLFPDNCRVKILPTNVGIVRLLAKYRMILKVQSESNRYGLTQYEYAKSVTYLTQWLSSFLFSDNGIILGLSDVGETKIKLLFSKTTYLDFNYEVNKRIKGGHPFQLSIITKPMSFSNDLLILPIVIDGDSIRAIDRQEFKETLNVNFIYGDKVDVFMGLKTLYNLYISQSH